MPLERQYYTGVSVYMLLRIPFVWFSNKLFIFATMLDGLKRVLVWLSRINHCKGFGVQSPSAYRFIREVVNAHSYYEGDGLKAEKPGLSSNVEKLCLLYSRMAKFLQPDVVLNFDEVDDPYKKYFVCSCSKLEFFHLGADMEEGEYNDFLSQQYTSKHLIRVALVGQYKKFLKAAICMASKETVIVIEGIHQDSEIRAFWKGLQNDRHTGVSFDLYYCGIIFFDDRIKQHYIVNF